MNFFRKNWGYIWGAFIFFALLYGLLKEDREQKLLQNSKVVIGILEEEDHSSLNFQHGAFVFTVDKKQIKITYHGDFSFLSRGDTVLIEYAMDDPSIARVKDPYYMQKYKHLKNQ